MSTFLTSKEQICITIDYTKGYETLAVCYVKLDCATIGYLQHQVIKGIAGCLSTLCIPIRPSIATFLQLILMQWTTLTQHQLLPLL